MAKVILVFGKICCGKTTYFETPDKDEIDVWSKE